MNVTALRLPIVLLALALTLAACGNEFESEQTAVSTIAQDAATPSGLTAGALADRIAAGWATIDRYRAETSTSAAGSPSATEASVVSIEEAILPDIRRQEVRVDGELQSEIVASGGNIYGRGPNLPGIAQPNRDPDVWITINGNVLGPDNAFSGFYQALLLPVAPPYSALDETDRARPAEELGSIDVTGRTCQQFRIADTELTGERVEVMLALEESGLVCSIQTTSGNVSTTTVYTYDQPADIELPASPVPAPAENG